MWNRKEVKAKGLKAFKANFWKCVGAVVLVGIIAGGISSYRGGINYNYNLNNRNAVIRETVEDDNATIASLESDLDEMTEVIDNEGITSLESDFNDMTEVIDNEGITSLEVDLEEMSEALDNDAPLALLAIIGVVVSIVLFIAAVVGIVFGALIVNPFKLGASRFFRRK